MNKLAAILLVFPFICEAADYTSFIEQWEDCKLSVYKDSMGKRAVGIGLNLDDPSSRAKVHNFGISVSSLLLGHPLTYAQAHKLHTQDVAMALATTRDVFPSFDRHPPIARQILVDLTFNLGPNRILEFKKFKAAIEKKDYKKAAAELVNSKWYSQVGRRAKHHVEALKNVGQ